MYSEPRIFVFAHEDPKVIDYIQAGLDKGIGPCLPTLISPTPVSPTLDQKVAFRLLIKNCIFGHQSDVKLHLEVG